jgi:hypothetical protein
MKSNSENPPTLTRLRPRAPSAVRRGASWLGLGLLAGGCASSDVASQPIPSPADMAMFEGPSFFEHEPAGTSSLSPEATSNGPDGLVEGTPSPNLPIACVIYTAVAEIVRQPVDIILLLDNSGSMSDELEAVEANINVNFAAILASSDVDYRVILISRHREEPRDESGESSTSICVQSPLSGLADCTNAEQPVFSERFFQYGTKLESTDSFDVLLETYAPPFPSDREEKYDQAPLGWSAWLRPGAKKVFLEMTDDDEDMAIADFVGALVDLAPEHFGSDPAAPSFVFHSIIGVAEKATPTAAYLPDEPVRPETCTGNDNDVENAGESYQELSRITGGLRFPLCQFDAYDVVFQRIAEDVVQTRAIECDFPVPEAPPGLVSDPENVAISYTPGDGAASVRFGQAPTLADCQADAFYIADGRLNLCPDTCSAVRDNPLASLTVLMTCESQLIVPR